MNRPYRLDGPSCPADRAHGPLLPDRMPQPDGYGWTCPHHAHDGLSPRHLGGPVSPTRFRFTTAEIAAS